MAPAKDGANSIFNRNHGNFRRVIDLRTKVEQALGNSLWSPTEKRPVGLELVVVAESPDVIPGDATNYLGGVADVLQVNVSQSHLGELARATLYSDDSQIQEVRYSVERGDAPGYRVRVWVL